MKTFIFCICFFCSSNFVTFSRWECSLTESIYKDGRVEYSAHYKGKEYILTWDQYQDLLSGKDITVKSQE